MKALVIFSGGQDSTTCLGWALNRFEEVECICFSYGQTHSIEVEQAQKICNTMNVKLKLIRIDFLNELVVSALTSGKDVNQKHELNKELPASWVPNRNALFLVLAHSYAQKIGADKLIIGVSQADYSGYPDCREEFIDSMEKTLNSASNTDIEIISPLMFRNKAQTFRLAEEENILDLVINESHTCYNGDRKHNHAWGYGCDNCPACKLRKKGYQEFIGMED